jgi:hypothetical protein
MKNIFYLTLLILLTGLSISGQTQKMNSKEIKVLVDSLSNVLNRYYVYPDRAALSVSEIRKKNESGTYNKITDQKELCNQLYEDLQKILKDPHLRLEYDPQFAMFLDTPVPDSIQKKEYEANMISVRENNFEFKRTEILPGNIGYVRWDEFVGFVNEAKPTISSAFQFVSNCKALIIDMRYNAGGSAEMVQQIQSYFFSKKTRMNDIIDRKNDTLKGYADPAKTNFQLFMPVYILTSRQTFSAAEDFTYGLQQAKRAIIVGDTTGGGSHPTNPFSIGQGFILGIPSLRTYNIVSKTDWEGTGVYPDIVSTSEQALTTTESLILKALLLRAKDEQEKNIFQWYLNSIIAETSRLPSSIKLNSFEGVYEGGLNFYLKDDELFCKNAERGNTLYKLKYIEGNLFVLDENVQVEFEKDSTGTYSRIKLHWKYGLITEKHKM